ncbi:PQQ-binding-like beta-propeller repeat protein [Kitasatospora sp. NPDC056731]|uniref:outer membrane protein assembly factor BamB family protein n=1 Tax=Kitasatospora sp. NPDC056731 TaxID=3155422 RepID=UPI0034120009
MNVNLPAHRHDPRKNLLVLPSADPQAVFWDREPVVCGFRRLTHRPAGQSRAIEVPISSSPVVVSGAGVVLGASDGTVTFYDRTLGKEYWSQRLDSPIYASLVADARRRRVIVIATSGLAACFDLRGRPLWSARVEDPVYATPLVLPNADRLVVAAFNSRCTGLNLETGARVFDHRLPEPWHAAHGGSAAHRDAYASPVATGEGNAVIACAEHVLCLTPDGEELWRTEVGHSIKASPVGLHDRHEILVAPVDGTCLFLDSRTGQVLAAIGLDAKVTGSPAASGGLVAVGTTDGTVTALDARSHGIVWRSAQGAPREYTSVTTLPSGDFVATAGNGNIVCLAREDGKFLWETSQVLGLPDHRPAMDITPVAGVDGSMYGASYSGTAYHFRFRPRDKESFG